MPSGSKRRKAAAKKKKEQEESNIGSTTTTNGGDEDLKTQDSDGGEINSPASQHHHQKQEHPFSEGERETSLVESIVTENKSVEEVLVTEEVGQKSVDAEDEGSVEIVRELKEDYESRDVNMEHGKSVNGSHKRSSSSSSSSSSSGDESGGIEKIPIVLDLEKPQEESNDLVQEVDSVQETDSSAKEVIHDEENLPAVEAYNVVVETEHVTDTVAPCIIMPKHIIESSKSEILENSVTEEGTKLDSEEKEGKYFPSVESCVASKESEDEVLPLSNVNYGETSSATEYASKETENKLLLSPSAPITETSNGVGLVKDGDIPEYSDNRPLADAAPRVSQTSSWKSCCGLFEVLTGSRR